MQKSSILKKEEAISNRKWFDIDASGIILGKLATTVANILRGKNKANFTPNVDCGDYVIIHNANKILLTGKKMEDKKYYTHSMYIGGLRTRSAKEMIQKYPEEMIYEAVKGMIPKTKLGKSIILKLFVYGEQGKTHDAQKPIKLTLDKEGNIIK